MQAGEWVESPALWRVAQCPTRPRVARTETHVGSLVVGKLALAFDRGIAACVRTAPWRPSKCQQVKIALSQPASRRDECPPSTPVYLERILVPVFQGRARTIAFWVFRCRAKWRHRNRAAIVKSLREAARGGGSLGRSTRWLLHQQQWVHVDEFRRLYLVFLARVGLQYFLSRSYSEEPPRLSGISGKIMSGR